MLRQQIKLGGLHLCPIGGTDGQILELGAKVFHALPQIGMVGHHQGHLHRQLPRAGTPEKIDQTMVLTAHEQSHPGLGIGEMHLTFAPQPGRQGGNRRRDGLPGQTETLQIPLQPTQK